MMSMDALKSITKYGVVEGRDAIEISDRVNRHLANGWVLYGPLQLGRFYYQVIVKVATP